MNTGRWTICLIALFTLSPLKAGKQPGSLKPDTMSLLVSSDIVAAHNSVRSKVGVPPLFWSDELAQTAQNWANTLIANGAFAHRQGGQYGENLFEIAGFNASSTPNNVVGAWAAESAHYSYEANSCSGVCGHYTQVVWRDTKAVGCGVARDERREVWVCNYAPFGNIVGEKPY